MHTTRSLIIAAALSPLVIIPASPIYGFFLSYLYGTGYSCEIALTIAVISIMIGLVVAYILLPTYGLLVYFFLKRLKLTTALSFAIAGAIPGLFYYQIFNQLAAESLMPGLYFGTLVSLTFWWLGIHGANKNSNPSLKRDA